MQNIHPGNSDTELRTKHHRPQQCISKFSIARQSDCSQATSRKTNKAASSTFFQAPRRVLLRQTNPPSEGAEPNGDKFRSYLQNLNRTLNATVFQGLCSVTSLHTNLHTTTLFRRATGKPRQQQTTFEHFLNVHFSWSICAGIFDSTGTVGGQRHTLLPTSAPPQTSAGLCQGYSLHCSQKTPGASGGCMKNFLMLLILLWVAASQRGVSSRCSRPPQEIAARGEGRRRAPGRGCGQPAGTGTAT